MLAAEGFFYTEESVTSVSEISSISVNFDDLIWLVSGKLLRNHFLELAV